MRLVSRVSPFIAVLVTLVIVGGCDLAHMDAHDSVDFPAPGGGYACVPASSEAGASIDSCELSFLSGGGFFLSLTDRKFSRFAWNVLGTTTTHAGKLTDATCQVVMAYTREREPRKVYEQQAGHFPEYPTGEEALRVELEKYLRESKALQTALPAAFLKCTPAPLGLHTQGPSSLILEENGNRFRFDKKH